MPAQKKLGSLPTLLGLFVTSGCTNAIRDGIWLGTSSGYNTAVDAFVQSLLAQVTEQVLGIHENCGGGDV